MSEHHDRLEPIARPDGGVYRPRKIVAYPVGSPSDPEDFAGVVVFGTHDIGRARELANVLVRRDLDPDLVVHEPRRVWWRDGMDGGYRTFIDDPGSGRAGVYFRDIGDPE